MYKRLLVFLSVFLLISSAVVAQDVGSTQVPSDCGFSEGLLLLRHDEAKQKTTLIVRHDGVEQILVKNTSDVISEPKQSGFGGIAITVERPNNTLQLYVKTKDTSFYPAADATTTDGTLYYEWLQDFLLFVGGSNQRVIYRYNPQNRHAAELVHANADISRFKVAPNNNDLAYIADGNLFVVNFKSGEQHEFTMTGPIQDVIWSPDATTLAVTYLVPTQVKDELSSQQVNLIEVSSGKLTEVHTNFHDIWATSWSKNGLLVGLHHDSRYSIALYAGDELHILRSSNQFSFAVTAGFSKDGSQFLYSQLSYDTTSSGDGLYDMKTGKSTLCELDAYWVDWAS